MNDETFTSRIRIQVLLNEQQKHDEHLLTLNKKSLTNIATERLMKVAVLNKLVMEKSDEELDQLWAEVINEE